MRERGEHVVVKAESCGIGYADAGRDQAPRGARSVASRMWLRFRGSFGCRGWESGIPATSSACWCVTGVARSGSDNEYMIGLGSAWPCAYLGWSSGRDSESGTGKSGVQGSGVDVGESNDSDAE